MFCSNCGKQIPDGSIICSYCGAQQGIVNSANSQNSEKKSKKNAGKIIIPLVVALVAYLIGSNVIAPMMGSDNKSTNNSAVSNEANSTTSENEIKTTTSSTTNSLSDTNSEYEEIFSSRHIIQISQVFIYDSESFARVDENDVVENLEFGYEDNLVKEMIDTIYYPISGYTSKEKDELEASVKESLAKITSLDFCSDSYNMGNGDYIGDDYYTVTLHFTNLDDPDNVAKLDEVGMVTEGYGGRLSMSITESSLLSSGYVKK